MNVEKPIKLDALDLAPSPEARGWVFRGLIHLHLQWDEGAAGERG